jgi:hypothetical protein
MLPHILFLVILVGCATEKPTPYQKEKQKEGYRDSTQEKFHIASFKANTYTKKDRAQSYAEFRAIEKCSEENKHANIIDIFDKTVEKEVIRSTGSSWGPSSYFGMYPYYSRYSSFGIGGGFNSISTDSWKEKLVYPYLEAYYTCANKIFRPQVMFKELDVENMKHLVKDVKGAIQVEKIDEAGPNKQSLELGDIILKANGRRIEKVFELIRLFDTGEDVSVQILREGEKILTKIKAKDVTEEVLKAEKEIIHRVCKNKKKEENLKTNKFCL